LTLISSCEHYLLNYKEWDKLFLEFLYSYF
jgi:hypothetical protein